MTSVTNGVSGQSFDGSDMRHEVPSRIAQAPSGTRVPCASSTAGEGLALTLRDVAGQVQGVLEDYLTRRRAEGAAVAPVFADEVVEHLSRLLLGGGKRLRPAFLWCGWRAAGGWGTEEAAVVQVGAALELLQGCALIHDDLMDSSPTRRGRPALHVAFRDLHRPREQDSAAESFGTSAALLAGDLALVWAQDLWEEAGLSSHGRQRARRLWQAVRTEMVAGQYLELRAQVAGACSPQEALRTAYLKAGLYTVQRPLTLGAALGGACAGIGKGVKRAGRCAGLAFQLRDDLLDVFGAPAELGKPAGEDVRQGKPTYLMTVGLERAREGGHRAAEQVLTRAKGHADLEADGLERVGAALTEVGARAHVEHLIGELARKALEAVTESGMGSAAAGELTRLISGALAVDDLSPHSSRSQMSGLPEEEPE